MSTAKQKKRHDEWLNGRLMRSVNDACLDAMWAAGFARMVADGLIISFRGKNDSEPFFS